MAKKKQEEPSKGSPAWMATFSDLMNLLLCFFVLLFSMSTVDAEKFQMVIASLQSSVSIFSGGDMTFGEGQLVGAGISQLPDLDIYFNTAEKSEGENTNEATEGEETENSTENIAEQYKQQELSESEQMAEDIEAQLTQNGIQNQVEVDFNAEYVLLTLNGAILFDSGKADVRTEAEPLIAKIGSILQTYNSNIIEIEGHTDNVPITRSTKFEDNDVLSMYRALSVADYIRSTTTLDPALIKSSGRGEYVPIADNSTEEGRARNRRVEIKVYNSYNSQN